MDVRLRLLFHPPLVTAVLSGVDGRDVRDAEVVGQLSRGLRHEPVVAVDQVVGVLCQQGLPGGEHVLVHPLHPRHEAAQIARPAGLAHHVDSHSPAHLRRRQQLIARPARAAGEDIHRDTLADQALCELADMPGEPALDHRWVLPGEDQDALAHLLDPTPRCSAGPPADARSCPHAGG